jgi:hypothetical protein
MFCCAADRSLMAFDEVAQTKSSGDSTAMKFTPALLTQPSVFNI